MAKERPIWLGAVTRSLAVGGALLLKCFDARPPRDFGPPGLTAREVLDSLGEPVTGGLSLELLRRTAFGLEEAKDHAAWTVLARRLCLERERVPAWAPRCAVRRQSFAPLPALPQSMRKIRVQCVMLL